MLVSYSRILSLTLIASAAGAVPALAATPIASCPFLISSAGNYIVTADLTCTGDAIDIAASNVSVNLNGHVITGPGANTFPIVAGINIPGTCCGTIGPAGRLNHIAIEGPGLIQKFNIGVWVNFCDFCQVALVTAAHNGDYGLSALSVNSVSVGSNVFVANGYFGIGMGLSFNGVIARNDLSGNGYDGLDIVPNSGNSEGNTVNNNVANANLRNGIRIIANNSRVFSNTTNGNAAYGIVIDQGYAGNQVFNNSSSVGNGYYDLLDANTTCGSDFWSNNVFFSGAPASCIH